jgi:hypothetical protein
MNVSFLPPTPAVSTGQPPAWGQRLASWLLTGTLLWIAGGAACYRRPAATDFPPPPAIFEAVPTLQELVAAVNRTDKIQKLQTNSARVTAPSMSETQLSASLMLERPKRFRLRGSVRPLPTTLVDLGSNEEVFWLQVPEGMRPTLYFAHHREYAQQTQRMILPVDPTWLIDALGLIHLDPAQVTEGPTRRPDGQLEIRSRVPMPDGLYRRVCVIDARAGFVTEQYLYAADNRLVARATASEHRYYEAFDCSLPHHVRVELQPAAGPPLTLEMEIGDYTLNQILSGDPHLFAMPTDAAKQWDLANLRGIPMAGPSAAPPAARRSAPIDPQAGSPLASPPSLSGTATPPAGRAPPGKAAPDSAPPGSAPPGPAPVAADSADSPRVSALPAGATPAPSAPATAEQGYVLPPDFRPPLRGLVR